MSLERADLARAMEPYAPQQIAERVETAGVAKARLSLVRTLTLAVLAGAFIALGAMLFTLVMTGADPSIGASRWLGGVAFSLGLVLVVIAGAELFTGNNLIVIAWADRRLSTFEIGRNWILVYLGNFIGALGLVIFGEAAGLEGLAQGRFGETAHHIALAKIALPFGQAFARGVLCNLLVCLAIWMCFSAKTVTGKILCIVFPISAFVALGFEHSIANMYLIPAGLIVQGGFQGLLDNLPGFLGNLVPVTLGNIIGGGGLVAAVYWLIYRKAR